MRQTISQRRFLSGRRELLERLGAAGAVLAWKSLWSSSALLAAESPKPGPADWPRFGYDPHNTRFNAKEKMLGPENVGRLKVKWRQEIGAPMTCAPVVIGDTVFVGAWDGHYYALDAKTGEKKWKFDAEVRTEGSYNLRRIQSTAQYDNGRIFFGTGDGDVICVEAGTGRRIWKTRVDQNVDPLAYGHISTSPTIYKDRLFVGTSADNGAKDTHIACLDTETGAVRWRFYVNPPDRRDGGGGVWTAAAVDEEQKIVYNVTGNPNTYNPPGPLLYTECILANDLETGELLWYYQAREMDPWDLDFSCHPMIFDAVSPGQRGASRRCVGAGNKAGFYTCDRYTGELLWKVMLTNWAPQGGPEWNSTAVAYNKVYVVSNAVNSWSGRDPVQGHATGLSESVTAALHAFTGEIVWWHHNNAMNKSPVCVSNGVFYQSLRDGSLEAYDAESGKPLWKSTLPSSSHGGIVIANGELYTSNGEAANPPPKTDNRYYVFAYSVDGK